MNYHFLDMCMCSCVCVCVCVRACVRACMRACVCVKTSACILHQGQIFPRPVVLHWLVSVQCSAIIFGVWTVLASYSSIHPRIHINDSTACSELRMHTESMTSLLSCQLPLVWYAEFAFILKKEFMQNNYCKRSHK